LDKQNNGHGDMTETTTLQEQLFNWNIHMMGTAEKPGTASLPQAGTSSMTGTTA
jgi:hypothetical protein